MTLLKKAPPQTPPRKLSRCVTALPLRYFFALWCDDETVMARVYKNSFGDREASLKPPDLCHKPNPDTVPEIIHPKFEYDSMWYAKTENNKNFVYNLMLTFAKCCDIIVVIWRKMKKSLEKYMILRKGINK